MAHRFLIADVFTDRPFGGSQLAVFPEAEGIPGALMQAIAREFNFSETTFVLPPRKAGHTHRVRIFTPHAELPFAGHPNVGTAVVLASLAQAAGQGDNFQFVFDEDVGAVKVAAGVAGGRSFAELTLDGAAEIRPLDLPRAALARMLSLPEDSVGPRAAWMAGAGLNFACVPLADREAVAAARFDVPVWREVLPDGSWARQVYAIAGDFAPGGRLKVRMWGPSVGVAEDPATGSAAGALAASLAEGLGETGGAFQWTIEQGAELGRPSLIEATAEKRDGRVIAIRVGGNAVIVAEGHFG